VLVAALACAGCGGTDEGGQDGGAGRPAPLAATDRVQIEGFAYVPAAVRVKPGTKLTFVNEDSAPHTATARKREAFTTGTLKKGARRSVKLDTPGSYEYFCEFHAFMKGRVEVR
jgi:plastocyanin